jgi:hypothetical protein
MLSGYSTKYELLVEVGPVLLDEFPPFARNGKLVEDGVNRTHRLAIGAVDAVGGIDEIHLIGVGGLNAIHGTNIHATGVFYPNAGFGYDKRHGAFSSSYTRLSAVIDSDGLS